MRRTKADAAITREQLLSQALRVFSRKGYASTTLQDIASEAGVTRGAIYWHFKGKAELYNTLISEYSERGNRIIQQAAAEGGSLLDILRRVFVRQLQAIETDRELRAMMELHLFKTGLAPELEEGRQLQVAASLAMVEMLAGIMTQGVELGLLRPDVDTKTMARAYLAFQNGLIQLWLAAPEQFSLLNSAESYADIFMSSIKAQK